MTAPFSQFAAVKRAPSCERGAVIPLFAMIIVVLLVFIALAVDIALLITERQNRERTAEHISLAALKVYMDSRAQAVPLTPQQAYNAALAQAQQVAQLNIQNSLTTRLRGGGAGGLWALQSSTAAATNSRLIPGQWLLDIPANATARAGTDGLGGPCVPAPVVNQPCFRPVAENQAANAFFTQLNTPAALTLQILFNAGLLPARHAQTTAEGYATLVPRRGVFLVDLSRSIASDTHLTGAAAGVQSEYNYPLVPGHACAGGTNPNSMDVSPTVQTIWNNLPAGPRGGLDPATQHYQSEFQCLATPPTVGSEPDYAFDSVIVPQPLTSIMRILNVSLNFFAQRSVSDDRVAIVGFDDGILPARVLGQSVSPFGMASPVAADAQFEQFRTVFTDTTNPLAQRIPAYFVPRPLGSRDFVPVGRLPALTDLRMALNLAQNMIRFDNGFLASDNFVVLITDGFSNCTTSNIIPGFSCFYSTSSPSNLAISQNYVQTAVAEITTPAFITPFRDDRIAVHVFLIGQESGAHTLARAMNGRCMTDNEARMNTTGSPGVPSPLSLVNPNGGTFDSTDAVPFFWPNQLYLLPAISGGSFNAIRTPCRSDGVSVQPTITAACAAAGGNGSLASAVSGCPDAACATTVPYIDNQGRVICNAAGTNLNAQVQVAMDNILSQNPFMLVTP